MSGLFSDGTTTDGYAAADAPLVDCPEGLTALGYVLLVLTGTLLLVLILSILYRQQRSDPFGTEGFFLWIKRLVCGGRPNPDELSRTPRGEYKTAVISPYRNSPVRPGPRRQGSYDTQASTPTRRPMPAASPILNGVWSPPKSAYSASGRSFRSVY